MKNKFTSALLQWHFTQNDRKMPWKNEKDPYKIWLSEIILQQTKVEQGLKYYEKFVTTFPTIIHLAKAKEDNLFKMWEGLGYYNRCKNLHFTAKYIAKNYDGKFPTNYADILALKGIGKYTAAAISSFAYNLPYAVVDGNVYRILSRYFGNATPIDSTAGQQFFATKAQELLDTKQPAAYNQAIMDFGATVCKPKLALCIVCPLQKNCVAYQINTVYTLPVKEKKLAIKQRRFIYFLVKHNDAILIRTRTKKDVWQNLNEFVLAEVANNFSPNKLALKKLTNQILPQQNAIISYVSGTYVQKLSHQTIAATFIVLKVEKGFLLEDYKWQPLKNLHKVAFPAIINDFLQKEKKDIIFGK